MVLGCLHFAMEDKVRHRTFLEAIMSSDALSCSLLSALCRVSAVGSLEEWLSDSVQLMRSGHGTFLGHLFFISNLDIRKSVLQAFGWDKNEILIK